MPVLGLGTSKCGHEELVAAVASAIAAGYRHLDCAHLYNNQAAVGEAVRAKVADGTVRREELFITSKLWRSFHRSEHMDECLERTLEQLGVEYVDLYLMHFPHAVAYAGLDERFRYDARGEVVTDEEVDYVDVWRRMQRFVADGRCRMLGVSNFNAFQLDRLMRESGVPPPVVNQVEAHPYLANRELVEFCHSKNVAVTAYCCVGES